jgi:hypothetical protein
MYHQSKRALYVTYESALYNINQRETYVSPVKEPHISSRKSHYNSHEKALYVTYERATYIIDQREPYVSLMKETHIYIIKKEPLQRP